MGPGLITANAGNDAGGIATYAIAGASYGYDLLWILLLVTIGVAVVQEMCARMGAVTGKGLSDLIRERFGVRWTVFAMFTLLVANGGTIVSEFAGIGASLELLGVSRYLSVPVVAILLWWLVVKGSYTLVEKAFLVMSLAFLSYVVSAFMANPDWARVARATVTPSFHLDSNYLLTAVALIGTTITPYMQLYVQSAVADKGITVAEYGYERVDVVSGAVFSNVVSFFIIVATAATLYVSRQTIASADDAARALAPLAGVYASVLFSVGLFGASMLAAGVLPLATSFAITEAFGWEKGISRSFAEAPVFLGLFTALIILGAAVTLIPGLPLIGILFVTQVVNGVLLPIVLLIVMKLINDRQLMGRWANGRLQNAVAWLIVAGVSLMAVLLVVTTLILPLFGITLGG